MKKILHQFNYVGPARNSSEIEEALILSARTFSVDGQVDKASVDYKRKLVSPHGTLLNKDVVVLTGDDGKVCGACFLIDRIFFRGKSKLLVTYFSHICISEELRGKGLSIVLMEEAIKECERRKSVFALLIARRAVDHFYNKFFFWGLSQYSKIQLSFPLERMPSKTYVMGSTEPRDLKLVNSLYKKTYLKLNGASERSLTYWTYVLWRTGAQNLNFLSFKDNDKLIGYCIFSQTDVYELAAKDSIQYLDLLHILQEKYKLIDITIHASAIHPIVKELVNLDFSIIQRQCNYGGHMVRIIRPEPLLKCLEDETLPGAGTPMNTVNGLKIKLSEDDKRMSISGLPQSFSNTCLLMGSDTLAQENPVPFDLKSFNIPLMDQI